MSRRYERTSTVLTSKKGSDAWGEILGAEFIAADLIDRILHHCHIVNIRGNSYRMRHHIEVWKALHPEDIEGPGKEVAGDRIKVASVQFSLSINVQFSLGLDSTCGDLLVLLS
jgi:hypothetical protein